VKALISGQAAAAVLIDREHFYSLSLDQPDQTIERTEREVACLFADAADVFQIDDAPRSKVQEELEIAWQKDRGLQLFLILLDPNEETENRVAAAECLDEFLSNSAVYDYIANRLYSAPLPWGADLSNSVQLSLREQLAKLAGFLETLVGDQFEIRRRHQAWVNLPPSLFGTPQEKSEFYFDAVRFGAFRIFATERGRKNWAILQLLSHPYFRGNARARAIFQKWAAPFKESATGTEFEYKHFDEDLLAEVEQEARREAHGIRPREAFEQAGKQRDTIKALLLQGNEDLALRYTDQLIAQQRLISQPEHIAKSLCDLAQFAKTIGSPELQLQLATKAITEAPSDAWSYATVGDAYRALADYQKALDAYHESGVLGDVFAAVMGRAQVLKDLGQITTALELLEDCVRDYPNSIVARNAKASALADFGRFNESLDSYEGILIDWPDELVTLTGRAQVLKESGHLKEALNQLNQIVRWYPGSAVAQYTRGEALRELGQIEDSLRVFEELRGKFPLAAEMKSSYARGLRDLGRFDEAIAEFQLLIESRPFNPKGYIGLAETHRKLGNLSLAHEWYNVMFDKFPRLVMARNGKACIFMVQGDYASAIHLLSSNLPATYAEWVSYHIRAMGYMRSGKLERAARMLEWGVSEIPWAAEGQYFKTALASLRLRQGRFEDTVTLAEAITNPSVKPVAQVLAMHAQGRLGNAEEVERTYRAIPDSSAPIVISLRNHLASQFLSHSSWKPEQEVFTQECDSLLLAA
jgi:tetratricopeptide (TPR) repeat protein